MDSNIDFHGTGNIIKIPLKLIQVMGYHPGKKFKFNNQLIVINILLVIMVIICSIIEIKQQSKLGLTGILNPIQTTTLLIQVLIKCGAMYFNQEILTTIMNDSGKFLKLTDFNVEVQKECQHIFKIIKNNTFFYLTLVAGTASCFALDPFISGNLPFAGVYPENYRLLFILIHHHVICVAYCHIMGFDTVLFAVCCETFVQFKLLHQLILSLKIDGSREEVKKQIKTIVDRQNSLIHYTIQINKLSSMVFLYQFTLTIVASCIQLFIILQPGFTVDEKIKCVLFMLGQIYEFAMYCGWSEAISAAVSEIADAAYNTEWYKQFNKTSRKCLIIMISRAQMDFVFTGGNGFVRLNIATLTTVFKSVLSFYAALKTMQSKYEN